jgi:hypothetical protein
VRRLSPNRDLFEADSNETIDITVQAVKTPYQVTFSKLQSGGQWKVELTPTPETSIEKRSFTMPSTSGELFVIAYSFPPKDQADPDAKYRITVGGADGTSDGPNDVDPPVSGNIEDLPYEFRLPASTSLLLNARKPTGIGKKSKAKKRKS